MVFQLGWAAAQVAHMAICPELSPDFGVRTELNSLRYAATVACNLCVYTATWAMLLDHTGPLRPEDRVRVPPRCLPSLLLVPGNAVLQQPLTDAGTRSSSRSRCSSTSARGWWSWACSRPYGSTLECTTCRARATKSVPPLEASPPPLPAEAKPPRSVARPPPRAAPPAAPRRARPTRRTAGIAWRAAADGCRWSPPPHWDSFEGFLCAAHSVPPPPQQTPSAAAAAAAATVAAPGGGGGGDAAAAAPPAHMDLCDWLRQPKLYAVAAQYMCVRLLLNVSQVYLPMYLVTTLRLPTACIAKAPLVLYVASLAATSVLRAANELCGRNAVMAASLVASALCSVAWQQLEGGHDNADLHAFAVSALLGWSSSCAMVTSLSMGACVHGNMRCGLRLCRELPHSVAAVLPACPLHVSDCT